MYIQSFEDDLDRIRSKIEDITSELMFGGLTLQCNRQLSFTKSNDLWIVGIPCEVKTIHDEIIMGKDAAGNPLPMSKKEKFGVVNLRDETTQQILREKYRKDIALAIDQGGRIIFIDSSLSTVAHDIVSADFNNNVIGSKRFNDYLSNALTVNSSNPISSIPVIIAAGVVGGLRSKLVWYQTYYWFNVAITKDKDGKYNLDESKYDKTHVESYLSVGDQKVRKYSLNEELNS